MNAEHSSNDEVESTPPESPSGEALATEDDHALVLAAQQGDLKAYDQLITLHRGKVYAMIQNMLHHHADAWDLTQEVFIKVWRALPKFEARSKFSTWLYRITHNVVYDWMRKRKIHSAGEFNDEILADHSIEPSALTSPRNSLSPHQSVVQSELQEKIRAAIAKLSPQHAEVITLREIEGYDYKEIATITDSSIGTVMSRLFYARKKLQALLHDERPRN